MIKTAMGLGCMGMSGAYGPADEAESIATIERALDLGLTMLDTADRYGYGHNEELVGRVVRKRRDDVLLATKFGMTQTSDPNVRGVDGRPEYVRSACDASLRRLGVETIDLYYQHRVDPAVPIEETVGAMAELVQAGKVRMLGLSEATAEEVRRAARVHPIAAYQGEYSLFSRDHEDDGVIAAVRELGITYVAYSPIGRGWLSGTLRSAADLTDADMRKGAPRWTSETFAKNQAVAAEVVALAAELGITPAQLALAWVRAHGDDIVPIPGTKRRTHLEENVAALEIRLTPEQRARIERVVPKGAAAGKRGMAKTATALAILGLWLFATSSVSAQSGAAQACGDANSSADQTISACGQLIKSGALHGNDLAIAYNNRGVGYLDKGQLDDAIADFTQALRADPSYVPAYLDRAIAYAKKEQAEPAIADYTQALRIDPKLGDAYYNRGVIYQDTARDDLAIADFTQALRFQPNNAVAYYYRGLAYHRKGQNDLASADFTQALRINPNFAAAKSALQNLTH